MKKISLILTMMVVAIASSFGQADAIEKYFDKYMDDENFTVVYISPKMFEMVAKIAPEDMDQETRDVIKDLKGLRILTTEYNTKAFYKEAKSLINTKEYEILMTVRDDGTNVEFLVKDSGDIINELLLLVGGDEFVMMSFVGNIDLKKIAKLANSVDIDGMEHLKNLDDKKN
ncbi:DUF4252 domain-containing protein [Portibacter lacus]|uniref:DUF4252 domain-containing protein n=1 Tax=Portibacter lacus TaxID=1099794 RepID=A0AA37SP93_9BACT|nr:DUF4252 domain-containing protein [Portibacter lacus]GLR16356.1 hypothetical protein GCM10007940_09710 [Portibacter lacus]